MLQFDINVVLNQTVFTSQIPSYLRKQYIYYKVVTCTAYCYDPSLHLQHQPTKAFAEGTH